MNLKLSIYIMFSYIKTHIAALHWFVVELARTESEEMVIEIITSSAVPEIH